MPFWKIYVPEKTYTGEEMQQIATAITDGYAAVQMPRFYVVVVFQEVPRTAFYVGGEPRDDTVRIVVDHIAASLDTAEARRAAMYLLEQAIAPFVKDRGLNWEVHIDETPIDLWRVQGLIAPPFGSEAEQKWINENKPTPFEEVEPPDLSTLDVAQFRGSSTRAPEATPVPQS
jgi:phenylpyruvate tautomerase PptA (4-oxalocrotonate tautomerase family)